MSFLTSYSDALQATVAYHLVPDNKKRINTDSYLKDELTEAHDAQNQYPSGKSQGLIQQSPPCFLQRTAPLRSIHTPLCTPGMHSHCSKPAKPLKDSAFSR